MTDREAGEEFLKALVWLLAKPFGADFACHRLPPAVRLVCLMNEVEWEWKDGKIHGQITYENPSHNFPKIYVCSFLVSRETYGEYGEDISGLGISRYPVAAIEELVDQVHECELRERDQK